MGGKGSGRPKEPKRLAKEALETIETEEIFANLHEWARGRPVICPYCDKDTGARTADTVALQSNLELLNRKLGKVPQQVQVDITETIRFTADQIDTILNRLLASPEGIEFLRLHMRELLPEAVEGDIIEGEAKEV